MSGSVFSTCSTKAASLDGSPRTVSAVAPGMPAADCAPAEANAPMVAVRFVGTDGKELPIDSRKLFGIQKGSDVVIRGSGVFDAKLGIPVIQLTADGIFVRPVAK